MVTVEKIKKGEKEYYRLVHSIRKGEKIIHKTKYLGTQLPPKARLEQLKKEFLSQIQDQKYKYFSDKDIKKIEEEKAQYKAKIKKLGPLEKKEMLDEFIIRFTYDSSKLSGVNVTLRQTSLILKEGIIPKDIKNIKTLKELENHKKGIIAITQYKGKLDLTFLKKLHKILMSGVWDEIAGLTRYELKSDVKVAGTSYVPPKWQEVQKELDYFFNWYKTKNRRLHPLELASLIHLKIISIQPFRDGNSRLSRLLMNWILWKKEYPLVDIPIEDLETYYDALDMYQIEKKEKPFVDYIKRRYLIS
ncbi:MAG: Fic family protein [Candidatus Aenigmarchaeota archaeon]|nr:Fic family protein [Candidatus Aenigmarchaeota archaeon]